MNLDAQQLINLEGALRTGCTIELRGVEWTFTPLTLGDMADHIQDRKNQQLAAYQQHIAPSISDANQRFRDLHDLLQRGARPADFEFSDPANLLSLAWRSLKHAHPKVAPEEVDALLSDDKARDTIVEVMGLQLHGPQSPDTLEQMGEGGKERPFGSQSQEGECQST